MRSRKLSKGVEANATRPSGETKRNTSMDYHSVGFRHIPLERPFLENGVGCQRFSMGRNYNHFVQKMNIDERRIVMSEDTLKELIRTGKLTQDIVDEARVKVDKTLQACAFALHALMCNKVHEHNPEMLLQPGTNKCLWYAESDVLEDCWNAPDHSLWIERTLEAMKEQEITEPEVMKEFLQKFAEVSTWYPKSFKLLEEVVKD